MKNILSILILMTVYSFMIVTDAFSQISNATTDSSKTKSSQLSKVLRSNSRTIQTLDNSHRINYPKNKCNELLPNLSDPAIKIFKPDTTLTASMPILKTAPVDQGIFIPGYDCIESDSLD